MEFLNSDLDSNVTTTSTDLTALKAPLMTRSMTELKNSNSDNESNAEETPSSAKTTDDANSNVEFSIGESKILLNGNESPQQNDAKLNEIFKENKKLKNEIQSLNGEIKSLLSRMKTAEDEFQRSKRKIDHFQNQISESDKIIRELRSREDDMSESIKSKESQIAVLRVKFEECDKELKGKKSELDNLKNESERLLREHSNSSDIQSQAFETLKEKLNEYESSLQREKDSYLNAQVTTK
jgi:peptidoglycan hydrolase CwlO-like protein